MGGGAGWRGIKFEARFELASVLLFLSPYALRRINDQLMLLERAFLNEKWKDDNNMMYP